MAAITILVTRIITTRIGITGITTSITTVIGIVGSAVELRRVTGVPFVGINSNE
jgi:hypothetical protein